MFLVYNNFPNLLNIAFIHNLICSYSIFYLVLYKQFPKSISFCQQLQITILCYFLVKYLTYN